MRFNIKARSLRLSDFSQQEVLALLRQHTEETGQAFTAEAEDAVWTQTQGQPWLVNALAYETCFEHEAGSDRSRPIDAAALRIAHEQLILRRETHLDQLADKLQEERVRRVVEPLLSGAEQSAFSARDLEYVRDLGLIALDDPLRMANPIYAEVVPRELTYATQAGLAEDVAWYVDAAGGWMWASCWRRFSNFSASTRSTGWSDSSTRKRVRNCYCRRFCSGLSTAAAGLSANTAWVGCGRTC